MSRTLAVDHVVDGILRRDRDRLQLNVQLIEAASGRTVWAERYQGAAREVSAILDDAVRAIASALAVAVEGHSFVAAMRRPPANQGAFDLWLRGKRMLDRWTPEANVQARLLFRQAIELDPAFARAHAGLAQTCEWPNLYSGWEADAPNSGSVALMHAQNAIRLDDSDADPHIVLAWLYHMRRDYFPSRRHLDRAMALNPNDADMLANRGMMINSQGDPALGRKHIEEAIRLNPRHPDWYICYLAASFFLLQDYERASALFEQAPDGLPEVRPLMAGAYALAGDHDAARRHLAAFHRTHAIHWAGGPSAQAVSAVLQFRKHEDSEQIIEGMRKAGIPA